MALLVFLFKQLWRVSDNEFQLGCLGGQFLTSNSEDGLILATAKHPLSTETFFIERNAGRVHIRLLNGGYVQVLFGPWFHFDNFKVLYVIVP